MKRYLYIAFLLLPLLVSCEREISYSGPQSEPVLVLEALPQAGSDSLICYINCSRFFLDNTKSDPASLAKVSLSLTTSSGACSIVKDSVAGFVHRLTLSAPLPAGDTVRITASLPGFPTIEASEYIVPPCVPVIESVTRDTVGYHVTLRLPDYAYKNGRIGINGVLYTTFTYTVEDPRTLMDTTISRPFPLMIMMSKDEIFAPLNSFYLLNQCYMAYTDEGERLFFYSDYAADTRVRVTFECPKFWPNIITYRYRLDSVVLDLEARSKTYTTYYASLRSYMNQNSDGSGMSIEEPVSLYTNITNGYGVLASKTNSKIIYK